MLHPGPLTAAGGAVAVAVEPGLSAALDEAAAAADPRSGFLGAAWYEAAGGGSPVSTLVARRSGSGAPLAAIPLAPRRLGPLTLREVPGCYWPFRSFPIAADAGADALARLLAAPAARAALGQAWRLGPVPEDDPAALALAQAAPRAGWAVLRRRLATSYIVDLAALAAAGPWPSTKRSQRNRWLERRLARDGELEFTTITGDGWNAAAFEALAAVEADSWVAREAGPKDLKFVPEAPCRRVWEQAAADPALSRRLVCWLLRIGGSPAAFVFCLDAGDTRHIVANGYSERFAEGSPGLVLLYRAFADSIGEGVARIDWGAGDAGHKSRMGAVPGAEIVDLLLVRPPLLARLAAPLWSRAG